jgi:hypothetical protein
MHGALLCGLRADLKAGERGWQDYRFMLLADRLKVKSKNESLVKFAW